MNKHAHSRHHARPAPGATRGTPLLDENDGQRGFASHQRVVVYHCSDTFADSPLLGFWMYLAPGSGVFYDLGKTLVARNASELTAHGMSQERLRAHGFDSVQFTHTWEDYIFKYEIVDVRAPVNSTETGACPPASLLGSFYSGWTADAPCMCSHQHASCLHCRGRQALDAGAPFSHVESSRSQV